MRVSPNLDEGLLGTRLAWAGAAHGLVDHDLVRVRVRVRRRVRGRARGRRRGKGRG